MTEEELMAAIDAQMTRGVSRLKVEFTEDMPEGERKEAYHHGRCDVGSPWAKGLAFDCDAIDETIDLYAVLEQRFGIAPPTPGEQDWEFTCGDPAQTEEYISLYHALAGRMDPRQKLILANMILQGFEERCGASADDAVALSALWAQIEKILAGEPHVHAETIRYWADLRSPLEDAWNVSKYIRPLAEKINAE